MELVVGCLENHLLFWDRVQAEAESVTAYGACLTQLIKKCDFREAEDIVLRDRFITGIKDDGLRKDLIARVGASEPATTFKALIDLATGFVVGHQALANLKFQCPICPQLYYSHEADLAKHNKKVHQVYIALLLAFKHCFYKFLHLVFIRVDMENSFLGTCPTRHQPLLVA